MSSPAHSRPAMARQALIGCAFLLLAASLGWLSSAATAAAPAAYAHESWSVRDGLPVNSVNQIIQSRSGYLWMATFDGLVRFDGARFVVHSSRNTPGLGHQRLVGVIETGDGRLLLGSDSGLLQLFDPVARTVQVLWTTSSGRAPLVWQGPDGTIWVSLEPGLGRLRGDRIERIEQAPVSNWQVSALDFKTAEEIRVGTLDDGVWVWTAAGARQLAAAAQISVGRILALAEDGAGALWLGGERGVDVIDAKGVRPLRDGDSAWRVATQTLLRNPDGSILIGSETGPRLLRDGHLQSLDPEDPRRIPQQDPASGLHSRWLISASAVFRASETGVSAGEPLFRLPDIAATRFTFTLHDRSGSLWLATSGAGLHRLRPAVFATLAQAQGLSAREVYPLHQSPDGAVWIGTQKGGLNRYLDGRLEVFGLASGLLDDNIRAIASDRDGVLWVATEEAGLFRRQPDGLLRAQSEGPLAGARIKALMLDRDGILWAGAESGLYRNDGAGTWRRHPASDAMPGCTIRTIRQADDRALWLGSHRCGLARLAGDALQQLSSTDGDIGNHVRDIHFAADGSALVASEDRGVSRVRGLGGARPQVVSMGAAHEQLGMGIHQILADAYGWLWMSSNRGILRVREAELLAAADRLLAGGAPPSLAIDSYDEAAGLRNREANGGVHSTALKAADGTLWFATQDGVAIVDPDPARLRMPVQPLIEAVSSGEQRWPADLPLELAAEARSFRIDYTELLQMDAEQTRFRYRLIGYDDDWIDAGSARSASYTKVPPGHYEFQVQAWSGGGWGEGNDRLSLTLLPYFTETLWFRLLLATIAAILLWLAYRTRVGWLKAQRRELQRQVDLRTEELAAGKAEAEQASRVIAAQAEQLRENDRQKSRFFDDLAHELRTPLTLIIGPLEDVRRTASDGQQPAIDGALRNSEVLLGLTNQLLDLARLEAGQLRLERRSEDLVALLRTSTERFRPLAGSRQIAFRWRLPAAPLYASLDLRHAGKIFDNLLSNAFKFTPVGGAVELALQVDAEGMARIEVSDTGSGIAPEHLPHVFDRFYQTEDAGARLQPGTGIGLALVHDLTELHGGRLEVRSTPGSGTVFSVLLPLLEAVSPDGVTACEPEHADLPAVAVVDPGEPVDDTTDPDRTTVLVVDDHAEIRAHVRRQLQAKYRVIEAADGIEALALARESLPDLIVADISMPQLDGYGLCAQVRSDPELEGLPIILLTARAGIDDRLEGLRAAADDYLTKPFHGEELRTRVDNLIALRRRLQQRFQQEALLTKGPGGLAGNPESSGASVAVDVAANESLKGAWCRRLFDTIDQRMADEHFKVAELAEAMAIDRTQLFRRVREETGMAPSDLLRDRRLSRAAKLLREASVPIAEVAYAVGFSSVAYFTQCFRERYGLTPGKFRFADHAIPDSKSA